jgi:Sulfite exporter TauE/SafE.
VPLLILLAHLPERVATATSLGAICITALAGAVVYAARGEVDVGYAALVGIPAVLGVLVGTALQQRVRTSVLMYAFAFLLCSVGVLLLTT